MVSDAADTEMPRAQSPETVDRVLIGACVVIWLLLVAVSVAAIGALVDLGRGHRAAAESGHSSWLLWTIIAVSAAIIIGAIPLLLRARRTAAESEAAAAVEEEIAPPVRPVGPRTGRMRVFGTSVDPYDRPLPQAQPAPRINSAALNRVWLRGTVSLVGAIGLALIGVSAMTYLLATSSTTAAWVALGLAGAVTVAMPALLVVFQRQLGDALDEVAA